MKIINPNQKGVLCTCTRCGIDLEISRADIQNGWLSAYFICPVCYHKRYISDDILAKYFQLYRE